MHKSRSLPLFLSLLVASLAIPAAQVNAQEEAPEFIFSFSTQFPPTDNTDEELENLREGVIVAETGGETLGNQLNDLLEDDDPTVPRPQVAEVTARGITFTVSATSVDENGNPTDAAFATSGTTSGVDTFDPAISEGRILVNASETLVITMTFDPSLEVSLTEIDLQFVRFASQAALLTIVDNPELTIFNDFPNGPSVPGYEPRNSTYTPPEEITISSGDSIVLGSNNVAGLRDLTLRIGQDSKEPLLGDVNLDTFVDFDDISPFITILASGGNQAEADTNQDGSVTFDDIAPFIDLLAGG